jgi:hypothetical protein
VIPGGLSDPESSGISKGAERSIYMADEYLLGTMRIAESTATVN